MPTSEREPGRNWFHGPNIWRMLILFSLGAVGLAMVLGVLLYSSNRDSIDRSEAAIAGARESIANNRDLGCRIGGFLVDVPIVKQPGITEAQFKEQVAKALNFLRALRALDCKGLGTVTTAKINKQTHALRKIVRGGGRSTGNPHRPGSPTGSGGPAAPPRPPNPPPSPNPSPSPDCLVDALGVCVTTPSLP